MLETLNSSINARIEREVCRQTFAIKTENTSELVESILENVVTKQEFS